ncbi:MAG: MucBP domain-containing protein, partial [Bacillota bacterium]
MKINIRTLLRQSLWLLLAVFLVFALPASAAELTPEELQAMPAVSITYYIAEGGDPLILDATPALSPLGKAYWAMLPPEAFSFPMTLTITASEIAPYTFSPTTGDALITDPATVDYDGWSTLITAYQNDIMVDTYRLYVSAVEMPLVVEPAEVPVYYVDAENNADVLHYEVVLAYYDQDNIITVNTGLVPANYTLAGDASAAVTVNELGQATPEWVTFYFQAQAMQGTLHIYYTDAYGTELASSQTQTLDPGTYTITPNPVNLPSGYVLAPESPAQAEVTVDSMGNTSPEAVTFVYEPQIVTGLLTVYYTDDNGATLAPSETLELATGSHTVTPNAAIIPYGYALTGTTQYTVNVDSSGSVSPSSVTFVYAPEQVEPVTGNLAVYYTDLGGNPIISPETRTLEQGQHIITPNDAAVPSGYSLAASTPSQFTVTVDAYGTVSPASVTFLYEQATQEPVTGTLTIQYNDISGVQIGAPQTETLPVGTHTVAINAATIPSGYTLDASSPTQFTVTVDEYGSVSPSTVTFILAAVPAETPALSPVESFAVTNTAAVNFRSSPDTAGTDNIAFPTVDQGTQVWVYGTFVLDGREWASISYSGTDCYVWYSLIDLVTETSAPVSGSLTVRYQTADSAEVAGDQILILVPGTYTVVPEASHVPAGYVLAAGTPVQFTVTVDGSGVASPDSVTFTFEAQTEEPTPTPAPTPTLGAPADISATYPDYTVIDASAATNAAGVRFRSTPSTASADNILYQVPEATAVWVHGVFTADSTQWAFIRYENTDCYVWYSLITLDEPIATPTPTAAPTDTPTPTPETTPTQTPLLGDPEDLSGTYPDYTVIGATAA